jgi:hypothetical protein
MMASSFDLYALSVDVDWAPDFMIDYVADSFTEAGVKCTWFITHASPAIERLRKNPLFELGIHPNFFEGSSHGKTEDEVIRHCLNLVPDAKSVRMHALWQNSRLLTKLRKEYRFEVDCTLFIPRTPHLIPHTIGYSPNDAPLVRLPCFWEDDVECLRPVRCWDIEDPGFHIPGMKMFNFHPMYVGLNENTFENYERVKRELCVVRSLKDLTSEELNPFINQGVGVNVLFKGLMSYLKEKRIPTYTSLEIANKFIESI